MLSYDEKVNLIIIGDSTVGKTSIIKQYFEGEINGNYLATVGVDHYSKDIELSNKLIRLKIWDTAGQERFKSLTKNFFKNAQGVILVYDVTNKETFNNLKNWISSTKENVSSDKNLKAIIIGNKIDLVSSREVNKQEAEELAKSFNYSYFETSAKRNSGIDEAIKNIMLQVLSVKMNVETNKDGGLRLTMKREYESGDDSKRNISISSDGNKSNSKCCGGG